jgi:hypothetical protein
MACNEFNTEISTHEMQFSPSIQYTSVSRYFMTSIRLLSPYKCRNVLEIVVSDPGMQRMAKGFLTPFH